MSWEFEQSAQRAADDAALLAAEDAVMALKGGAAALEERDFLDFLRARDRAREWSKRHFAIVSGDEGAVKAGLARMLDFGFPTRSVRIFLLNALSAADRLCSAMEKLGRPLPKHVRRAMVGAAYETLRERGCDREELGRAAGHVVRAALVLLDEAKAKLEGYIPFEEVWREYVRGRA